MYLPVNNEKLPLPLIQPSPSGEGFKTCVDTYAQGGRLKAQYFHILVARNAH